VADLTHSASREVGQRPDVVHARLLELAERFRRELPPIEPGTQAANVLGIAGRLPIEIADRDPGRIDLRTTDGRIRGEATALIAPAPDDRTSLSIAVALKPQGFAANVMLGVAMKARPSLQAEVVAGLERGLDDLVVELAKPDGEWDAAAWQPPGVPARS
jgi:hypothetical protein